MKNLYKLFIISNFFLSLFSCPPLVNDNNIFTIETEVPIYCRIQRGKILLTKRLEAGKSVEVQCYDSIILSRDKEGTQAFYQVELYGPGHGQIEDGIEGSLVSRSTPLPPDFYFNNHLRYVYFGWDYKRVNKTLTYTLRVTKEMSEGPLFHPNDFKMNTYFPNVPYRRELPLLLVYMVADNDLYSAAIETINRLERAYRGYGLVYIYLDAPQNTPHAGAFLIRLMHDQSPEIKSKVIKVFGEVDSCNFEHFNKICKSMQPFWTYRSILIWSHGTSWLPASITSDQINLTALGKDESANSMLDIAKIATVTNDPIIFDACRMASAEVFSCFGSKTVIAPSVDIEPLSYPYSDPEFLIALLYQQYEKAVDMIVDYNQKLNKEISMTYNRSFYGSFWRDFGFYLEDNYNNSEKLDFATIRSSLLPLGTTQLGKATLSYDLLSLIQEIEKDSGKTELADALKKSVYVRSTPTIWNGQDSSKYCGISCYVPYHYEEGISEDLVKLNEYYLTLPWGKKVGRYCKPLVP